MQDKVLNELVSFLGKHVNFLLGILINLVIIYVFCKITDLFARNLEVKLKDKNPNSPLLNLLPILVRIVKVVVVFLLLAGFLQSFGYNVTSLIAGFGITGLAVGFAAKETLGNVFGSIGLLADKVYKIGEYVQFSDVEGTVEAINLRSTTLRTTDGFLVNVPNNVIANEPITNMTQITSRKVDIGIDIEYGTTDEKIDKAIEILKTIAQNNSDILDNYTVYISELAPSSIVVKLLAYTSKTAYTDFIQVKSAIYKEVISKYREENINFAFPSTSLYIEKQ